MKISQLTSIRFFAAFLIVIFHAGLYGKEPVFPFGIPWLKSLLGYGFVGVNLFFVLSGFILTIVYLPRWRETNRINFKKYFIARIARVYPLYALAAIWCIVGSFIPPHQNFFEVISQPNIKESTRYLWHYFQHLDWGNIFLYFSTLQAWIDGYSMIINSPSWSISVEFFFYISFPFVIRLAKNLQLKTLVLFTLLLWIVSIVIHLNYIRVGSGLIHFPLLHFNVFCFGVMLGFLYYAPHTHLQRITTIGLIILSGVVIMILYAIPSWRYYMSMGLFNPISGLIIFILACSSHAQVWLGKKWLVFLGEVSYGIYILQQPIHEWVIKIIEFTKVQLSATSLFWLYAIILTIIASLSYTYIETPIRKWINSFAT